MHIEWMVDQLDWSVLMHTSCCRLLQVDCTPPGNIVIRVLEYRPTSGGYIKITPLETAGVATVSSIDYKASSADVRHYIITKHITAFQLTFHAVPDHQLKAVEATCEVPLQLLFRLLYEEEFCMSCKLLAHPTVLFCNRACMRKLLPWQWAIPTVGTLLLL